MRCYKCNSENIIHMSCPTDMKCRIEDVNSGNKFIGVCIKDIGLGEFEDYISFSYCLNCGRIQDNFPKFMPNELT